MRIRSELGIFVVKAVHRRNAETAETQRELQSHRARRAAWLLSKRRTGCHRSPTIARAFVAGQSQRPEDDLLRPQISGDGPANLPASSIAKRAGMSGSRQNDRRRQDRTEQP